MVQLRLKMEEESKGEGRESSRAVADGKWGARGHDSAIGAVVVRLAAATAATQRTV